MSTLAIETALLEFSGLVITHHNFREAQKSLAAKVDFPQKGEVVLLVGASGTGTSAALGSLHRHLLSRDETHDPFRSILLGAPPPAKSSPTRDVWKNGLHAANAPILGQRIRSKDSASGLTGFSENNLYTSPNAHYARFQNALRMRRTIALLIRQADRLTTQYPDKEIATPIQQFHQLANSPERSPGCVILSGQYDLLRANHVSAGTSLITSTIEILPYQAEIPNDLEHFAAVLMKLQKALGEAGSKIKLIDHFESIFRATRGIVGWVMKALRDALYISLITDQKYLTWELLKQSLPDKTIQSQIQDELDLRNLLSNKKTLGTLPALKRPPRNTKPGERKPNRDPVGEGR